MLKSQLDVNFVYKSLVDVNITALQFMTILDSNLFIFRVSFRIITVGQFSLKSKLVNFIYKSLFDVNILNF